MTKFAIPTGTKTAFRIPAKPVQPEKQDIERIGVSAEVASEMLGVSVRTMLTLAKAQKIRTVRIGTRVVFSVQPLREFIDGKPANADKPNNSSHNLYCEWVAVFGRPLRKGGRCYRGLWLFEAEKMRLLETHGLIRKIPKHNRYQVSTKGRKFITALLQMKETNLQRLNAIPI